MRKWFRKRQYWRGEREEFRRSTGSNVTSILEAQRVSRGRGTPLHPFRKKKV